MGKPATILFPPDRLSEELDLLDRIQHGDNVQHFDTVRIRKDGTRIDVSVTISPIRDKNGVIRGASKIARDITERRRAEEVLREQAQVLDLAQVMVRDTDGRIVQWTVGSSSLYGYSKEEAIGRLSHELLKTEFPQPLQQI